VIALCFLTVFSFLNAFALRFLNVFKLRVPGGCACVRMCDDVCEWVTVYGCVAEGKLDKLEGFVSHHGADFYKMARNPSKVRLTKETWTMPASCPVEGSEPVVPFFAGDPIQWKAEKIWLHIPHIPHIIELTTLLILTDVAKSSLSSSDDLLTSRCMLTSRSIVTLCWRRLIFPRSLLTCSFLCTTMHVCVQLSVHDNACLCRAFRVRQCMSVYSFLCKSLPCLQTACVLWRCVAALSRWDLAGISHTLKYLISLTAI